MAWGYFPGAWPETEKTSYEGGIMTAMSKQLQISENADGCCKIDRRMGIYGYPIEIQALFFMALRCALQMLKPEEGKKCEDQIVKLRCALQILIHSLTGYSTSCPNTAATSSATSAPPGWTSTSSVWATASPFSPPWRLPSKASRSWLSRARLRHSLLHRQRHPDAVAAPMNVLPSKAPPFSPTHIRYKFANSNEENLSRGIAAMLRILAAAGAQEVRT